MAHFALACERRYSIFGILLMPVRESAKPPFHVSVEPDSLTIWRCDTLPGGPIGEMLSILESGTFAVILAVVLAIFPWISSQFRTKLAPRNRRLSSSTSAWARVERISRLSSDHGDPVLREATHGALFDALRTATYRQVRRPTRRHAAVGILYIIVGLALISLQVASAFTEGKVSGGEVFATCLGVSVCLMSLTWFNSTRESIFRNTVYRNRIELMIQRRDPNFLQDPVRATVFFGSSSTTDQAFDIIWRQMQTSTIVRQASKARRLHVNIKKTLSDIKSEVSNSGLEDSQLLERRIGILEGRVDKWFASQVGFRAPAGPRMNLLRIAKSLKKRGPIQSIRSLRGAL